jgi:hypothetical protein
MMMKKLEDWINDRWTATCQNPDDPLADPLTDEDWESITRNSSRPLNWFERWIYRIMVERLPPE